MSTANTTELTPYDTGDRLEPHPWVGSTRARCRHRATVPDDYGRVDFDTDEGATVLTAYVAPTDDGYRVHLTGHGTARIAIEDHTGATEDVDFSAIRIGDRITRAEQTDVGTVTTTTGIVDEITPNAAVDANGDVLAHRDEDSRAVTVRRQS